MIQNTTQRSCSKHLSYSTPHAPTQGHTRGWPGHLRYCTQPSVPGREPTHIASSHKSWPAPVMIQWLRPPRSERNSFAWFLTGFVFLAFFTHPLPLGGGSPITGLQLTRRHQSQLLGSLPAWPGLSLGANHLHVKIMSASQARGPTTASFIPGCRV